MRPITVTVGPNAAPNTPSGLVAFDPWAMGSISKQASVNGTATFSVQVSNDDPNSPTNPVPLASMNWSNDPDATFVGATGPVFGNWQFVPLYARVLLTAGTGSATVTFVQSGSS